MDRPWHEDASFWETVAPFVFSPGHLESAAEQVAKLVDLLELPTGAHICDLPCGVGRHAVEMADRDHQVTGVDLTEEYLERARERAIETGVEERCEFLSGDMRQFVRPETFDCLLNLYTSFGYFESRADDERTAQNWYDSLVAGGTLLMSLASKETISADFEPRGWSEVDGTYFLEERTIKDNFSWIENRWTVINDGTVSEYSVSHRLYSAYELTKLLERVGFDTISVFGSLTGEPFDQTADQLVVRANK